MNRPSERRFTAQKIRSAAPADGKKYLAGYAAKFGILSSDLGGFRERLERGCFTASLKSGANIAMLSDHDASKVLGRTANGTLSLAEDATGLQFRCELPATTAADDLFALVERGDVSEMSFAFDCENDGWADELDPDEQDMRVAVRNVRRAKLFEISAVTFPAYPSTSVNVSRSLFPGGVPAEVRSHASMAGIVGPITSEEHLFRARMRLRLIGLDL